MHQRKDVDNIQALFLPLHYFLVEKVGILKSCPRTRQDDCGTYMNICAVAYVGGKGPPELVYTLVGLVKYFGLAWRTPDKVATTY